MCFGVVHQGNILLQHLQRWFSYKACAHIGLLGHNFWQHVNKTLSWLGTASPMVTRCDYKQRIPNTRDPQCDHSFKMSQLLRFSHLKISDLFSRGLIGGRMSLKQTKNTLKRLYTSQLPLYPTGGGKCFEDGLGSLQTLLPPRST